MALTSVTTDLDSQNAKGMQTAQFSTESNVKEIRINSPSLSSLLKAGTLAIPLIEQPPIELSGVYAEDGWLTLQNFEYLPARVSRETDLKLLNNLCFLQLNAFVRVTYVLQSYRMVILRLYIVPWDLPGLRGVLRYRNEARVMVPARKMLREVLMQTNMVKSSWLGEMSGQDVPFFSEAHSGDRTLPQIFNDLTTTKKRSDYDDIPHLRATLYNYQKESVAAMLDMEKHNGIMDDPLYITMTTIDGSTYYLQPATLEILLECPRYSQGKGGFLCEELGTGKTVMILALVLTSRKVLPKPPEGMSDDQSFLTPLSLRHFPYSHYSSARNLAMRNSARGDRRLPSLVEICCDYIRTSPEEVDIEQYEEELEMRSLWDPIMQNTPFYLHLDRDFMKEFQGRRQRIVRPRIMYLSPATLIVVPRTLVAQWKSEILKHCTTSIRHLVIKGNTMLPPAHKLATDYDIIIISDSRISTETSSCDESALHVGYNCHCKPFARIRVPDCHCSAPKGVSTLLQVRWKRLVRDEGHNAASLSTNLNHFLKLISAERRWIVTGTPTTNLLGLNLGKNSESVPAETTDRASSEAMLPPLAPETAPDESYGPLCSLRSPWSSSDREDIRKLGSMMENFLCVPRFAGDPRAFETLVAAPLFARDGPLPGAVEVLTQVMSAHMIRHRISDIERDVVLPPMQEETVLLDLDPYAKITYNVLLASIVINAVDSERKDIDYLFHPMQSFQLAATIENLSHALFWRVDEYTCDWELMDTILRAQDTVVHATERNQPEEDLRLVDQAIIHLQIAYNDNTYRAMQHGLEIPYRLHRVPLAIIQSWGAFIDRSTDANDSSAQPFMYPKFLLELRRAIERQPLISLTRLAEIAELVRDAELKLNALAEERVASLKSGKEDRRGKKKVKEEHEVGKVKLKQVHRAVDTKAKLEERQKEYLAAQEKLLALAKVETPGNDDLELLVPSFSNTLELVSDKPRPSSSLMRLSPLASTGIGNSMSSKLNYILDEVIRHSSAEKFLIFSNQPFNLVHIAEGLELLGIKFLQFTAGTGADRRDQDLTTFETSETYRVFLMELRYGARGLNIVSASRVIFCEPVWHADVESQAIKRVHRIGQTRPVIVKTLAIRNTFEEQMIKRRKVLKGKTPGMMEEGGIRYYLQHPSFLEEELRVDLKLDFPLLQLPEEEDSASTEREPVSVSEDIDMRSSHEHNGEGNHGNVGKIKITLRTLTADGTSDTPTDRVASNEYPDPEVLVSSTPPPSRQRRKLVHFA